MPASLSFEEQLRALIAAKLRAAGRSFRWVERKLKLSHGTVSNLIAGRTALRFEHLDLFAQLFEVTPAALLAEAMADSTLIAQVELREKVQQLGETIQAVEEAAAACRSRGTH